MENNINEKFNKANNSKDESFIKEAISELENSIKKLKTKAGDAITDENEKIKDKVNILKDKAKDMKKKYNEADPVKQKMVIAAISAALASIITAIGLKSSGHKKQKNEDYKK